jgi:hypothetical protein
MLKRHLLFCYCTALFHVRSLNSFLVARLFGEKHSVDVWQDSTGQNCDSSLELVEFLVILDGKSNVTRCDTCLFVVTGGISRQFKNFGTEVLKNDTGAYFP